MKTFINTTVTVVLAVVANLAWAQMPGPMPMPGYRPYMPAQPGAMAPMMGAQTNPMAALGLNEEQRKKIAAIAGESQADNLKLMNQIRTEMAAISQLFAAATLDEKKISAAYQKVFDLQRKAVELSVRTYNRQIGVFNAEQLKKWNTMRAQMMGLLPARK